MDPGPKQSFLDNCHAEELKHVLVCAPLWSDIAEKRVALSASENLTAAKQALDEACSRAESACHNRLKVIQPMIERFRLQDNPPSEVVLVKNNAEGGAASWIQEQDKVFSRYISSCVFRQVNSVAELAEPELFCKFVYYCCGASLPRLGSMKLRMQKLEAINQALHLMRQKGARLVAIGGEDILDGRMSLILGVVWVLILRPLSCYHCQDNSAKSYLLSWVRSKIPQSLTVTDFTKSFHDGVVMVELIRALVPRVSTSVASVYASSEKSVRESVRVTLMCLKRLGIRVPKDVWGIILEHCASPAYQVALAYDAAYRHLGVPKLLDAFETPEVKDELSVLAYVTQLKMADQARELRKEETEIKSLLAKVEKIRKADL